MARPKNSIPSLTLHKPSGRACVWIDGKDIYLGLWGSAEAQRQYGQLIKDLASNSSVSDLTSQAKEKTPSKFFSINELILAFIKHAAEYYIDWCGKPTAELHCFKSAFRPLKKLFGETQVNEFGPLSLGLVRDAMIEKNWSRGYVNKSITEFDISLT